MSEKINGGGGDANGDVSSGNFFHFSTRHRTESETRFSLSATEQKRIEDLCAEKYDKFKERCKDDPTEPALLREKHISYLRKGLASLPKGYETLDASRPWIVYWILQSLSLLEEPLPEEMRETVVGFLKTCAHPSGGYGGGPGQDPHLATTYAAVMALSIAGNYESIDRAAVKAFLLRMKQRDGAFTLHENGEEDIRGVYCAIAVATLLNIVSADLIDLTPEWIISCQTYEGGFGAVSGAEAHGGYTYCGLAALILLGHDSLVNLQSLARWVANKQMTFEGGFQGRTTKLVDGCYSFWQAACFPLMHSIMKKQSTVGKEMRNHWLFDTQALQDYILICCQWHDGGLVDKPGKRPDFYHTCYTLSGLSIAQHFLDGISDVVGPETQNKLGLTHPLFNIPVESERNIRAFFSALATI